MKFFNQLLLAMLVMVPTANADPRVAQVISAVSNKQAMPQFGQQLDTATAYQLQGLVVKQLLDGCQPDGFKAGLTSKAAQRKFAVSEPVAGVLLAGSGLARGESGDYVLARADFARPMLELEMGFRFAKGIKQAIADVETLKRHVSEIVPVIELPDLGFIDRTTLLASDIIANNVAARFYIAADKPLADGLDINRMRVALYRNGQLILEGQGSDAMGDQWQALLWLVNRSLASGWEIKPGQLLITGALGKMLAVEQGAYRADFGGHGEIKWRVE